jgi:hypothetical protein
VPFHEQRPAYDALRQTAAIILGVLGVWIGVLHPQAVSKALNWKYQSGQVKRLQFPMLVCVAVIGGTLLVGIVAPAASVSAKLMVYRHILRGASFGTLVFSTSLLILSLIMSLAGFDDMKDQTDAQARQERATKNLLPANYTFPSGK